MVAPSRSGAAPPDWPTGGSRPHRRPDVGVEPLPDGSVVLYDPRAQLANAVSESAGLVWQLCDGAHDVPTLTQVLVDRYDAPVEQIQADVTALLRAFRAAGLLAPPRMSTPD